MNKYQAQGIADAISRSCKCAVSAKIDELLAERNIHLSASQMQSVLVKVGDLVYSELWQLLADEEGSDRPKSTRLQKGEIGEWLTKVATEPDDEEEINPAESLRQSLQDAKEGKRLPLSEMWEEASEL